MRNTRGRVIVVGDRRQSIYGFRGADPTSMDTFHNKFQTTQLPLSICYRCAKSIVKEAQRIVPAIECSPVGPEGYVGSITKAQLIGLAGPGDLILCRTNAPLVGLNMELWAVNKPAVMLGKDLIPGLVKVFREVYNDPLKTMCMEEIVRHCKKGIVALDPDLDKWRIDYKEDQMRVLCTIIKDIPSVELRAMTPKEFSMLLEGILGLESGAITLSTIHKQKGAEANRVFIYGIDLLPHPRAETPVELQQEANLEYVAITRAKQELYYVEREE